MCVCVHWSTVWTVDISCLSQRHDRYIVSFLAIDLQRDENSGSQNVLYSPEFVSNVNVNHAMDDLSVSNAPFGVTASKRNSHSARQLRTAGFTGYAMGCFFAYSPNIEHIEICYSVLWISLHFAITK